LSASLMASSASSSELSLTAGGSSVGSSAASLGVNPEASEAQG
jgi:hypothetical protein